MALLDAYATEAEYIARVGSQASTGNTTLQAQLVTATRLLERSLGWAPGAGNSNTGIRTFDAHGGTVLRLRDSDGRQEFLQSIDADGLGIDSEDDGTYDGYSLDLDDAWLRGLPENAAAHSEPYEALELLTFLSTCQPSVWPTRRAVVQITGTWGWAAVPGVLKELTVHLTHDLIEAHAGGATLEVPTLDAAGPGLLQDQTWRLWREARAMYNRRLPAVA